MMHILKQLLCVVAVASATEATTTASSGPSTTKDANATAGAQGLNVVLPTVASVTVLGFLASQM